jgi:succinylarginine dihydrolase
MWAANAATVSPSADTADRRVHFTPANLVTQFHRSLEPQTTAAVLKAIFADERHFAHHAPLPSASGFSDEGAANHTRLCRTYGSRGIEIFVYGRSALRPHEPAPRTYPARQTREACGAIARLHGLRGDGTLFLRQNPDAIDAGAFHNDVVAVGNLNVFFFHEQAFATPIDDIPRAFARSCGTGLEMISVSASEVSLADAVESYLFNSQLVRTRAAGTILIAPAECETHPRVRPYLDQLLARRGPIDAVDFVDVRQSMRNGGGPACLRLRVALTQTELGCVHPGVVFSDLLYEKLKAWVRRHYRERLHPDDLRDVKLLHESRTALDELTRIFDLGSVYRFQRQHP